jgi:hypothetical protein
MCWNSRRNDSTLANLMDRWPFSTAGLFLFALAVPRGAHAQAEAAPEPATDLAPAQVPPQSTPPAPALPAPAVPPTAQATSPVGVGRERGPVFVPYLGMNLPVGSLAEIYSAGFRVGALAGWHVTPRVSINGEGTLDLMDADTDASILKPHEYTLDVALSPLVHFRSGEIVVGPKLGWFTNHRSDSEDDQAAFLRRGTGSGPIAQPHSGQGFLLGLNAGGFVPVGKLAIGLLASGSFRHFVTTACGVRGCGGLSSNATTLSLSLATLF